MATKRFFLQTFIFGPGVFEFKTLVYSCRFEAWIETSRATLRPSVQLASLQLYLSSFALVLGTEFSLRLANMLPNRNQRLSKPYGLRLF